ncbi:MAG: type II toxin-antitoxin system VapC family toxin [Devosia sp.]|uniref:type II toxin-antitoxin system VapC family toxin n=1 Tax=Devosia sp. TaxID=1871048 RepID=UPI001AC4334A|nr:type II toxin-antitoxin system VapC family toxin [Devosia sp.]MBN9314701.1 type II toxin-antitoxin system VapC family toxin [Devosia sp.]
MIVVDTSVLLAIIIGEPEREMCLTALASDSDRYISAGTLVEAFVSCERKGLVGIEDLIEALELKVHPVDADASWIALEAYRRWGRGRHPAKLNFGDCFSYVAARQLDCSLLFVGDDFSQTDVRSVL